MKSGRDIFFCSLAAAALFGFVAATAIGGGPVILRGVVLDPEGNPLGGATVSAVAANGDVQRLTQSTKKGKFGLRVPDFDLVYILTVGMEGYGVARAEVRVNPENNPPLTVTLSPVGRAPAPPPAAPPTADPDAGQGEPVPEISEERQAAIQVFNEGVGALEAGDASAALEKFKVAAEIDAEFAEAFHGIAVAAEQLEDYAAVANAAERLVHLEPDNLDAVSKAYFSEIMIKDLERLIPAARRLVEARPEVATNEMAQHARVLFDEDEFGVSKDLLVIIIETAPDFAPAYLQLGLTCNMLQDTECTKRALTRFLELAPDDPEAAAAQSLLDYLK